MNLNNLWCQHTIREGWIEGTGTKARQCNQTGGGVKDGRFLVFFNFGNNSIRIVGVNIDRIVCGTRLSCDREGYANNLQIVSRSGQGKDDRVDRFILGCIGIIFNTSGFFTTE